MLAGGIRQGFHAAVVNVPSPVKNDQGDGLFQGQLRYLLSHGLIDQSGAQILISAVLALAGVAWSTVSKMLAAYELRKASAAPNQPV